MSDLIDFSSVDVIKSSSDIIVNLYDLQINNIKELITKVDKELNEIFQKANPNKYSYKIEKIYKNLNEAKFLLNSIRNTTDNDEDTYNSIYYDLSLCIIKCKILKGEYHSQKENNIINIINKITTLESNITCYIIILMLIMLGITLILGIMFIVETVY